MISLAEPIKQNCSKKVDEDKDIRVLVVKSKKISTTIASAIFASGKLLTASTKVTLLEDGQDVRVKKV